MAFIRFRSASESVPSLSIAQRRFSSSSWALNRSQYQESWMYLSRSDIVPHTNAPNPVSPSAGFPGVAHGVVGTTHASSCDDALALRIFSASSRAACALASASLALFLASSRACSQGFLTSGAVGTHPPGDVGVELPLYIHAVEPPGIQYTVSFPAPTVIVPSDVFP